MSSVEKVQHTDNRISQMGTFTGKHVFLVPIILPPLLSGDDDDENIYTVQVVVGAFVF